MFKRFATLILISAALAGCVEKAPPVNVHEADPTPKMQDPPPANPEDSPMKISEEIQAKADASNDPLIDVMVPLSKVVFNNGRVRSAAARVDEKVQQDLISLNGLMLTLPVESRSRKEYQDIIDLYVATLNLECGQLKASCIGLKYLRQAGNSYGVVKIAALLRPSGASRLVLFAVDLKNRLPDLELLEMVLTKVPPSLPGMDTQMQEAVRSFLDSALAVAERSIQDPAETRKFLTRINGWNLILGLEWKIGSGSQQALWTMLARARMIYDGNGQLTEGVRRLISYYNAREGSFFKQQEALKRSRLFHPEALGGGYITRFDELFFLVDSVFEGRMIPRSAADVFFASGRSARDLSNVIEMYARMRFAFALRDSSFKAKEIFTSANVTEDLFFVALRQAPTIKRIWGTTEGSMDILKTFAAMSVKAKPDGAEEEARLRKTLNSFGSSVSSVAIYPHMMLLFYYLSQKNFKIDLPGATDITTADIMMLFFYGFFPPILPYNDSRVVFNNFEILYSFDMAVRTNLFPLVGLSVDDFMSDTLRRLDQTAVTYIENSINLITQRYQVANAMKSFRNACNDLRNGTLTTRDMNLSEFKHSAYYGELTESAFNGVGEKGGTITPGSGEIYQEQQGLMYSDAQFGEAMEKTRLDLRQYLMVAEAMYVSYTSYLKKYEGKTDAQIANLTVKTRAEIDKMKALRARMLSTATELNKNYGDCYARIAVADWKMSSKVMRAEEEFLRQVYRDIVKLRSGNLGPQEKAALIDSYKLKGLPSDFPGQDAISENGYRASQFNLYVRMARYLTDGLRTDTKVIPPIAPNVRINYGSKLDLDTPLVANGYVTPLSFTPTEDEFVAQAIRTYFAKQNFYVSWFFRSGQRIIAWSGVLKTIATLYRFEREFSDQPHTVSASSVLGMHEEFMKLVQQDGDERWFLETLHIPNRFDLTSLEGKLLNYLVDEKNNRYALQSYMGLYDFPMNLILREMLGYNYDYWSRNIVVSDLPILFQPRRFGGQEMALNYYKVRSVWNRGNTLVPYNKTLDSYLDASVRGFNMSETAAIREFISESATYSQNAMKRPPEQRPYADIASDIRLTSPLVSEALPASWEANVMQFNRQTQQCFVSNSCPDFQ